MVRPAPRIALVPPLIVRMEEPVSVRLPRVVVESLFPSLPRRTVPDWMVVQPVPPFGTGRIPVTFAVRSTRAEVMAPAVALRKPFRVLPRERPPPVILTPPATVVVPALVKELRPEKVFESERRVEEEKDQVEVEKE